MVKLIYVRRSFIPSSFQSLSSLHIWKSLKWQLEILTLKENKQNFQVFAEKTTHSQHWYGAGFTLQEIQTSLIFHWQPKASSYFS